MPIMTPNQAVILTDKLTAAWIALLGSSSTGAGDGTYGFSKKLVDLKAIAEGSANSIFADYDSEIALNSPVNSAQAPALAANIYAAIMGNIFNALDQRGNATRGVSNTISNLDTFLQWYNFYNANTYWQCMASPDFYYAYSAVKNGTPPNPLNLYFEVIQGNSYRGATFTNALGKLIVGTGYTQGYLIPIVAVGGAPAYAGGFAFANVSGLTGSGLLTVTGKDQSGNSETWTATISAGGLTALVPQARAYSLISSVVGIVAAGGISAATIYIEAHAPSGRTNPPT